MNALVLGGSVGMMCMRVREKGKDKMRGVRSRSQTIGTKWYRYIQYITVQYILQSIAVHHSV